MHDAPALNDEDLERLTTFFGYGNPRGPLWFVGHEEGIGGTPQKDITFNLRARTSFAPIMDLYEAHLALRAKGAPIDITAMKSFTQVWTWMGRFARAHERKNDWPSLEASKVYVQHELGRRSRTTFLTEIFPIPARGIGNQHHDHVGNRDTFQTAVRDRRLRALQEGITQYRPRHVLAYGSEAGKSIEAIVSEPAWKTSHSGKVRWCVRGETQFILTPFFGNGRMTRATVAPEIANLLMR